ncbi:HMG-Y-related protein A [Lactuca sativa]|uniref:H15 domain-containing protein n=1 Tax=Lactuca sativa TaxID=4236 RepID=A0A9R1XRB6_LACSA|nr:HMG-Y-related protein A [Lactuca sativa]KAJ0222594.1 hypothetical protein LSAT_V11C200075040 [Lactuca sativa]
MAAAKHTQSPSLPPYSEMIFAAIDSLKVKEGASESSISDYIESTCDNLPDEHANILTDNLNKLVESGELVVLNDNYMRPEPTETPKRGRGRPPKAKDPSVSEAVTQAEPGSEVKRGRGRPKKDPNAPSSAKKVKVGSTSPPSSKTGRPRGRPRKVQPELTSVEAN